MTPSSPEKGLLAPSSSPDIGSSVVVQPEKAESMTTFLEGLSEQIGEASTENPGEQWSGQSGGLPVVQQTGSSGVSIRDQAIAAIPQPAVMQKELEKHIRMEVKKLRKQAMSVARMSKPGAAYKLNQLYAQIRQLNALLAELFEASYEALKRLFIKVFIDKQQII